MGSIKGLQAATGCTQLITIHQPSPGVFDLFDGLIMLKQGSMRAARRPPPAARRPSHLARSPLLCAL